MGRWAMMCGAYGLMLMNAWPALVYASGITAAQNRQCIGLASAHQVAAGSRNVRLYPDQTLAQLKADNSFTFSDAELKAIVNNVISVASV